MKLRGIGENKKPSVLGEGFFSDKEITIKFSTSSI
jgi:hypothetical protein